MNEKRFYKKQIKQVKKTIKYCRKNNLNVSFYQLRKALFSWKDLLKQCNNSKNK